MDDLARSDVVTAEPNTSATQLATTMRDESVGSVVIVDGTEPVGIVTDRDLTVRILAEGSDPTAATASDVMTEDLCTIEWNAGFYEATARMSDRGIRRLPVCRDGELVGIISADDLIELIADEKQQLAEVLRAQRPEY
ncbi:CBS domain [Halalkaliarchaeum sp. AArc-CO]|nr:CBS domain [Halalkaliarchaeum sp. AArc-CO]